MYKKSNLIYNKTQKSEMSSKCMQEFLKGLSYATYDVGVKRILPKSGGLVCNFQGIIVEDF